MNEVRKHGVKELAQQRSWYTKNGVINASLASAQDNLRTFVCRSAPVARSSMRQRQRSKTEMPHRMVKLEDEQRRGDARPHDLNRMLIGRHPAPRCVLTVDVERRLPAGDRCM